MGAASETKNYNRYTKDHEYWNLFRPRQVLKLYTMTGEADVCRRTNFNHYLGETEQQKFQKTH
jgi:hypothetical protein